MSDKIGVHVDSLIGQTQSGFEVKQVSNGLGGTCWKAVCRVDSIFGQSIEGGEVMGIGRTAEEATDRMKAELKRFNESLWI